MDEYWGLSLDDVAEQIYQIESDAIGGHYITFEGSRDIARQKMIDAFTAFIDKHLYRATEYGYRWSEEEI